MEEKDCYLYDRLRTLSESDEYPFHMPGHKRNPECGLPGGMEQLDITEIIGFDNLHHAEGILRKAMQNAAELYHSEETFFLVNGSSCGILAAISTVVGDGETLILGRNAHASAYHGIYLRGAKLVSLYPDTVSEYQLYGVVRPESVDECLVMHPEARAVMITSPTYDGFVSDVRTIAKLVHARGKLLIVDEAHGAHFGLDPRLPENSISCGADLVIHSVHKTLPSLTQTALLHVNGPRVDRERLRHFLAIYQSSSPSYLLMGSIDHCIRDLQQQGKKRFDQLFYLHRRFYERARGMKRLYVIDRDFCIKSGMKALDPGKLLISTRNTGLTGHELQNILLERYHLQMEMAGNDYVLAILTVMDTEQGVMRLADALCEIDYTIQRSDCREDSRIKIIKNGREKPESKRSDQKADTDLFFSQMIEERRQLQPLLTLKRALEARPEQKNLVRLEKSAGRISCESIYIYPPGIPVVLPGEIITEKTLQLIRQYQAMELSVQGIADRTGNSVYCMGQGILTAAECMQV